MADLENFEAVNTVETAEVESLEINESINDNLCEEMILENTGDLLKTNLENVDILCEQPKENIYNSDINFGVSLKSHYETPKDAAQEVSVRLSNKQTNEDERASVIVPDKIVQFDSLSKPESLGNTMINSCRDNENSSNCVVKEIINLADAFSDSSQSLISEVQSSATPFEPSGVSQENHVKASRIDFQNLIQSEKRWKEANTISVTPKEIKMPVEPIEPSKSVLPIETPTENISSVHEIPVITIDDNTEPSAPATETVPSNIDTPFLAPGFLQPLPLNQPQANESQNEVKVEGAQEQPPQEPIPVPVIPPAPRKRGRPRKQVLPNPSPLMESWGSNAQEFPAVVAQKQERKRSARGERRQYKKKKLEDEGQDGDENVTRRRRTSQATPKKKRRSTYVPKKKLPPLKKKHSEIENFQNFEEETRMSASEGPGGFSSRSGAAGDESQGSSATMEGAGKSSVYKKGRMEVGADGCKPVTVQQIVEYFWPPPSSLPHGEKPEGLMIQEQITEYLGVKSFKRKYPNIKRRPVDMEERNYLQENGFVSENMCDMGLTAVFAADIIEIMYNDFPHKFEEYRKYTREKKAREQRALREKQAAERADMDPKKEAIESTISWNSEFNKTRRFKVVHVDPKQWVFTDGRPCPASSRLVLLHAPCNAALCVESDYSSMSLFSHEYEISNHSKMDTSRQYSSPNIWMFAAGSL